MTSVTKRYVLRGGLVVPEYATHHRGLGDTLARALYRAGIKQGDDCTCPKRQAWLNRLTRREPYRAPAIIRRRPPIMGGSGTEDIFFNSIECPHVGGVPVNSNHLFCDDFDHGAWIFGPQAPRLNGAAQRGWLWANSDPVPSSAQPPAIAAGGVLGSAWAATGISDGTGGGGGQASAMHGFYPLCGGSSITPPQGCANGRSTYEEIYFRWYWKFAPGYVNNNSQKVLTWNNAHDAFGVVFGGGPTLFTWDLLASPFCDCQHDTYRNPLVGPNAATWCYLNQNPAVTGNPAISITTGRWYYVEVRVKLNTYCAVSPGTNANAACRNGVWQVWANDCGVDGVCTGSPILRSSYPNVAWKGAYPGGASLDGLLGNVWWDNWGGSLPGGQSDDGQQFMDLMVASRAFVGFAGASGPIDTSLMPSAGAAALAGFAPGRVIGSVLTPRPTIRGG